MKLHHRIASLTRKPLWLALSLGGLLLFTSTSRAALVGYWGLDELINPSSGTNAQDYAPDELNGIYYPLGGVGGGPIVGIPGATPSTATAADFNGTSDEVFLGSPAQFKLTNNFTIAAWINPDLTPTGVTQRVFSQLTGAPAMGYGFGIIGNELKFTTYGRLDYVPANTDSFTIPTGQWTHIVASMASDNSVTFYQNGRFVTRITAVNPAIANTANRDYYIGSTGNPTTPERFGGLLDDVQIYNTALTVNDVRAIYGLPQTTRLVGHWKLDETVNPSGNKQAADSSGNGFNGTYQPLAGPGPIVGNAPAPTLTGTSADFNGTNDEVFLASPLAFRMRNDFTIMAWINPDATPTGITQRVFSQNGGGFGFGLIGNELKFTTYGIKDYQGNTTDGFTVPAGQWSHIAVVLDEENDARFYLNGVFVEEIDGVTAANVGTTNFFLGSTGTGERFGGLIDDVRLYSGALNLEQIRTAAGIPEPSSVALAALGLATVIGVRIRRKR